MPIDLSAAVPDTTFLDATVNQTNIDNYEAAVVTWLNTNIPNTGVARGAVLGGGAAYTLANSANLFMRILFELANNGTSTATKYKRVNFNYNAGTTTGAENIHVDRLIALMPASGITYREYLRAHATEVFNRAKALNYSFRVGRKAGVDEKYGYAGFDAAIYATGMNTQERAAADAAFQISIARSQTGGQQVSDALEVTKGRIAASTRTMMF